MALPSSNVTAREFDPTSSRSTPWHTHLVIFEVDAHAFAIELRAVREINPYTVPSRAPLDEPDAEGVINLRGHVIPVHDLARRLGLERSERTSDSRTVIVEVADRVLAFVADRVREVARVDAGAILRAAPSPDAEPSPIAAVALVGATEIPLLDLASLLSRHTDPLLSRAA